MKNYENLKNSENLKSLEDFENLTISERVLMFAMQRNKVGPKFENSNVGPKAKRPQKNHKNKIPTHPMTMPQAAGKKLCTTVHVLLFMW